MMSLIIFYVVIGFTIGFCVALVFTTLYDSHVERAKYEKERESIIARVNEVDKTVNGMCKCVYRIEEKIT